MTKGEIEKAAADWRTRWEKFPSENLLHQLATGYAPDESRAILASAMIGMSTQATVELVRQLIRRATLLIQGPLPGPGTPVET